MVTKVRPRDSFGEGLSQRDSFGALENACGTVPMKFGRAPTAEIIFNFLFSRHRTGRLKRKETKVQDCKKLTKNIIRFVKRK